MRERLLANSPYAEGNDTSQKSNDYSKNYDWNIVSGIMFNHESVLEKENICLTKSVR